MVASTRRRPGRARAILALIALAAMLAVTGAPTAASGDEIADKKAQAAAIAAKIEQLNAVVEQYAEAANGAAAELEQLNQQVAVAQSKVAAAEAQLQEHKGELRTYAVDAYVKGSDDPQALDIGVADPNLVGQAQGYLTAAAGNRQQLIDTLRSTEQDVQDQIAQLNQAQGQAQAKTTELNGKKAAADGAVSEQRALKNQVDAQLTQLIAAEQARRAQAAEAAAAQRRAAAATIAPRAASPVNQPTGPVSGNGGAGTAVSVALAQQGKPYVWGGSGPDTFDCSGLVMYAWGKAGVSLPHLVSAQYSATRHVSLDQIQPGDIIYYNGFGHNGMYIGNGQIVHAPHSGDVVKVVDLYWVGNPIAASRP
jgi:cell wall-associated NlpC family hydrolase